MNLASAALWGFVATLVMTTLEAAGRGAGLTRISIPFMLGTIVTGHRDRAQLCGFLIHIGFGWVFAMLYALIFDALRFATWWLGLILGVGHAMFVLMVLLPLLPAMHPRMAGETYGPDPTPMLAPPGFMVLNYGNMTSLVTIIAHAVYGIILGSLYHPMIH
jgi:uncharacterized membrane protein YagU involved in acid resistance